MVPLGAVFSLPRLSMCSFAVNFMQVIYQADVLHQQQREGPTAINEALSVMKTFQWPK